MTPTYAREVAAAEMCGVLGIESHLSYGEWSSTIYKCEGVLAYWTIFWGDSQSKALGKAGYVEN